jgi:hypothetical protein
MKGYEMKTPKLTTREQMEAMTENPMLAQSTIGAAVVLMMKSGEPISREAIVAFLEDVAAERRGDAAGGSTLAKGALRFISTLPLV